MVAMLPRTSTFWVTRALSMCVKGRTSLELEQSQALRSRTIRIEATLKTTHMCTKDKIWQVCIIFGSLKLQKFRLTPAQSTSSSAMSGPQLPPLIHRCRETPASPNSLSLNHISSKRFREESSDRHCFQFCWKECHRGFYGAQLTYTAISEQLCL